MLLDALVAEGARIGADALVRPPDDPDRLAILQFTSGSTAAPKGVMLPDGCVVANIDAIVAGASITHDDRAVSWLPLYHDMGLIGLLMTPMVNGFELVLGAPQDFLAKPASWLEWISEYRGTITAGPNFSYALAARALRRAGALDLSSWRLALNGAETVDPGAVESFCAAAAPYGFDPRAAYPVFGMAEATLGVTFPEIGVGMTVDAVDRPVLEHERRAVPASPDRPRKQYAASPSWVGRSPGSSSASSSPAPASSAANVRSASSSCAARRSPRATTGTQRRPPPPSTTAGCAPATSPTSSTASSWSAGG